jgi:hypothetical protein
MARQQREGAGAAGPSWLAGWDSSVSHRGKVPYHSGLLRPVSLHSPGPHSPLVNNAFHLVPDLSMSDIRQRRGPLGLTLEQRQALLQSSPAGYQRTPRPPSRSNRSLHISISLLILAFFVIYAHNNRPTKTPYAVGGKALPSWYAFCSKDGRRIYTIPEAGGEGAVECVVVHGKVVAETGSLGRPDSAYAKTCTHHSQG